MKSIALAALAVLVLAGCQKREGAADSDTSAVPQAAMRMAKDAQGYAEAAPPAAADAPAQTAAAKPITISAPMLAYSYAYGLETEPGRVQGLMKVHEKACLAAGPTVCQVVGQSVESAGKDQVVGDLSLRATPAWLQGFRDGLADQAKAAGGKVVKSQTESEDLTRSIVDTEAALRAKTTLRDRLQALLATRPGKLSDLLEVEQALSEVQQQIDAAQSELAVMRTRVATSAMSIHYSSTGVLAPEGVMSPLSRAFSDFLGIVVGVLAAVVRLVAIVIPLAVIVGLIWWPLRKRLRWPGRKKTPPAA